jgi:hypothetical protein
VISLLEHARILTQHGFHVIPTKNKRPVLEKWEDRRKLLATEEEHVSWFSNGKADGVAITINETEFAIDTDGTGESLLQNKIVHRLSRVLKDKIDKTMHTRTPHGHHRSFKINQEDFPEGIKEKTIVKLDGHNEIAIKGKNHYLVERGLGYEIVNNVDCIITLSKDETEELFKILDSFKSETNGIRTVLNVLAPHYKQSARHKVALALSGHLHKGGVPKYLIHDTIEQLASKTNDSEILDRLKTVQDTCNKDPNSEEVSGYQALLEVLDNDTKAITEIEQVFAQLGSKNFKSTDTVAGHGEGGEHDNNDSDKEEDELKGIDIGILEKLTPHVYAVISSNPPLMYVAHKGKKKIVRTIVKFITETTMTTDTNGQKRDIKRIKQILLWKQKLILAIPVKVIINDNPIDDSKTYQVTFTGRSKKSFTVGPGSISYIIEELVRKGKVLRKTEAVDAFTAILNRYEELGLAEIHESITQAGYYYVNGKFETHDITQVLEKEPDPNQIRECITLLDELSTKWQNKDIFPTVIKWATLAPFNSIFKANDKWLRNIHAHGWSSSGKTSLGKIALAIWRLHTLTLRKDYQLRFGNIDSTARFGSVISRSTYPKVINEAGGLHDKFNRSLLDLIKGATEAPYVRGNFFEGRYQNIPALCNMFLTSNSKPPEDSGYRSRTILIQHTKDEVHERGQKDTVEFEKWLDSKLHILGVLGDFITRYVIVKPLKPKESLLLSDKSHEDMAKEIITTFYNSVGKDRPEWLDRLFEQRSIVEENTENAYFEIRAFLMDHITDAYSRHIRTLYREHDPAVVIDFNTRLNFCMKNKLLPFLHSHTRKDGIEEVIITHDILKELRNKLDHIEGITTLEDLGKEIPSFMYCQRKLGLRNKNTKVLAGKDHDFVNFLEGKIGDEDA